MKYNEFEKEIECWGQKHGYVTKIMIEKPHIYIMIESDGKFRTIATVSNVATLLLDMDWPHFEEVEKHARAELLEIVTEIATTEPEDRQDKKDRVQK